MNPLACHCRRCARACGDMLSEKIADAEACHREAALIEEDGAVCWIFYLATLLLADQRFQQLCDARPDKNTNRRVGDERQHREVHGAEKDPHQRSQ